MRPELGTDTASDVMHDLQAITDLVQRENRAFLVDLLNQVAGVPSYSMRALQEEFVFGCMEPAEAAAFVEVCSGMISVAFSTEDLPR